MKKKPLDNLEVPKVNSTFFQKYKLAFIPLLFAFALYFNTLHHGFVLDDVIINQDVNVVNGIKGIPALFTENTLPNSESIKPYRPITNVSFALDYQFFKDSIPLNIASKLHLMNVIYYSLALFLTFIFTLKLFKNKVYALAISLLFAAHPIHTEVVANSKSRDEILAYLFGILALILFIKFKESKNKKWLYSSVLIYFIAVLSKESAILFLAIIPFISYYLSPEKIVSWHFLKDIKLYLIPAVIFLTLQKIILGINLMPQMTAFDNMLVAISNPLENLATRIYLVGFYLYKLCIPNTLIYDYSIDYITKKTFLSLEVWLSIFAISGLIVLTYKGIIARNKMAFGLLFMFIMFVLTCNLFIEIGTTFAERLAFSPSLGFVIALVFLIEMGRKKVSAKPILLLLMLLPILGLYSFKTIERNEDWKSNETLFAHDYAVSTSSFRVQNNYASSLYERGKLTADLTKKREYILKSIALFDGVTNKYPGYIQGYLQKGISYLELNDCDNAIKNLEKARSMASYNVLIELNLGTSYINCQKSEDALVVFRKLLQKDKMSEKLYLRNIGVAHINLNRLDSAEYYFDKVKQNYPDDYDVQPYIKILADRKKLNPINKSSPTAKQSLTTQTTAKPQVFDSKITELYDSGFKAYQNGEKTKAKSILLNLLETTPTHAMACAVLGLIYYENNQFKKSLEYTKRSISNNPNDIRIHYNLANSYFKLHNDKQAVEVLEQCIKLAPKYDKPYRSLIEYYTNNKNTEKVAFYTQKLNQL